MAEGIQESLKEILIRIACPMVWFDGRKSWPQKLFGGTCFFLRTDVGVYGVTAAHVVDAFSNYVKSTKRPSFRLIDSDNFDLLGNVVGYDSVRDIATFKVKFDVERELDKIVLDCTNNQWPPSLQPARGSKLAMCGFPEALRVAAVGPTAEFEAWAAYTLAAEVSEDNIHIAFDPNLAVVAPFAPKLQEIGMNLSGCSGGPVLLVQESHGNLINISPVAIVIGGPKGIGEGLLSEFDAITLRRINSILPDGSIAPKYTGWLPS